MVIIVINVVDIVFYRYCCCSKCWCYCCFYVVVYVVVIVIVVAVVAIVFVIVVVVVFVIAVLVVIVLSSFLLSLKLVVALNGTITTFITLLSFQYIVLRLDNREFLFCRYLRCTMVRWWKHDGTKTKTRCHEDENTMVKTRCYITVPSLFHRRTIVHRW